MGMNGPVRKYEVFSLVLKREGVIHEQHIGIGGYTLSLLLLYL